MKDFVQESYRQWENLVDPETGISARYDKKALLRDKLEGDPGDPAAEDVRKIKHQIRDSWEGLPAKAKLELFELVNSQYPHYPELSALIKSLQKPDK